MTHAQRFDIGRALLLSRSKANLSQSEIAKKAGFSRTYVSKVENGYCIPTLESLALFAFALEIAPWRLVKRAFMVVPPGAPAAGEVTA